MSYDCILLGSGGHAKSLVAASKFGEGKPRIVAVVSLDPAPLELLEDVPRFLELADAIASFEVPAFLNGVGISSGLIRRVEVSLGAREAGLKEHSLVSAFALVDPSARVEDGVQVLHRSVVNACSKLGQGTVVNTGAIIEHDVSTGQYCFIGPGAILLGGVALGENVMIGAGVVVNPGVVIADGVTVGSGAVVTKDIVSTGVYAGNPARRIEVA